MQPKDFREDRTWKHKLAAVALIGCLIPVVGNLGASGHSALAWASVVAAIVLGWLMWRAEDLFAARSYARQQLDQLEDELRQAKNGEGDNYCWVKSVRGYAAFDHSRDSNALMLGELRSQGADLDTAVRASFWLRTGEARDQWRRIAFEAKRSVQGLSDSDYWTTGINAILLTAMRQPAYGQERVLH